MTRNTTGAAKATAEITHSPKNHMGICFMRALRKSVFEGAILFCALIPYAGAADVCIRDGGTGDGSAWDNALDVLPASLTRGNTYYVADGSYASYTFNDAESGSTLITIKKATVAAHGPATGWDNAYGDGQAVFGGSLQFATDYYLIDGVSRNESDWLSPSAYGFRASGGVYIQNTNLPPGADNITVQYCDLGPTYSQVTVSTSEAVYLGGFDSIIDDITISHCFLHNSSFVQATGVDGITIEYCAFAAGWAKEAIRGQSTAKNGIIRYNLFYNSSQADPEDETSGCTAEIAIWDGGANAFDNWDIYGNIIWNDISIPHSGGAIIVGGNGTSWAGEPASNIKIYNNTIAGVTGGFTVPLILINGGTGNEIRNTLWFACEGTPTANPNTSHNSEEASDPFVNYAGFDFRLSAALAGASLGSPYNTDLLGETRGADGTWDVGTYEYDSSPGELVAPIANLGNLTVGAQP